ncbi:LPS export ABC transporter periplasmic protein LptC [Rhodobacter ferrooxidans]|uniref:Lipopolysaccharide export system protein LptC n=1 Tax=Rhodobacter ferrooxidans TaxID=371731 RepID=C8S5C8_9RHOB|nr:LPS export ABC transporter periplasmic protein LptC [Rhodobacter sp. SW2]EEW23800.1 protein of unknown function DUF1239 [Rhodobacter sp. SW2]
MALSRHDNLHSRLVGWLKVLLPLLALVILSTLFMVSRKIDPQDAIPYAEVDVADRIREPRMTEPAYAGVTEDGASLTVTADAARPDASGKGGTAQTLRAELDTPDGAHTSIVAQNGTFDDTARQMRLNGGVQITTSTGYLMTTEALVSELDRTEVTSAGPVAGTGPLGVLSAGQMRITATEGVSGSYVLVFKNRVKLIYRPPEPPPNDK